MKVVRMVFMESRVQMSVQPIVNITRAPEGLVIVLTVAMMVSMTQIALRGARTTVLLIVVSIRTAHALRAAHLVRLVISAIRLVPASVPLVPALDMMVHVLRDAKKGSMVPHALQNVL